MAMPIVQKDPNKLEKDILVIQDADGTKVFRITNKGELVAPEDWNLTDSASAFWESVLQFIPADSAEQIQRFGMLIRAYSLLQTLRDQGLINIQALDKNPEISGFSNEVMAELDKFFNG